MELNPNHPVTAAMSDQWHKFVAIIMHKIGQHHIVISEADVDQFMASGYGAGDRERRRGRRRLHTLAARERG